MKTAIRNQRKMIKDISTTNNSDEGTAFINCSIVKRLLTVPVTGELFLSIVGLCYKFGPDQLGKSLAIQMVNGGHSKANIKKYIGAMLSVN